MDSGKFSEEFVRLSIEVASAFANDKTAKRGNRLRMRFDHKLVPAAWSEGIDVDKELQALLAHKHASVRFHAGAVLLRSKSQDAVSAGELALRALVDRSHPEAQDVGFLAEIQLDLLAKMRHNKRNHPS